MKLDWMKEVDWKAGLTEELRMVLGVVGEDVLMELLDKLSGQRIHFSNSVIRNARREYVRKHMRSKSARRLAFELGSSESAIHKIMREVGPAK